MIAAALPVVDGIGTGVVGTCVVVVGASVVVVAATAAIGVVAFVGVFIKEFMVLDIGLNTSTRLFTGLADEMTTLESSYKIHLLVGKRK